ncbi:Nuclear hormone receptor ligand-binding domain [Trinorchestia longiramus]|nr:Nuclear hormone receptor ligand-binding domain [Trinorchestia longiramus]
MSKKQREKVEDEVRYHKNQMRAASVSETSPDSSVYEPTSPSQDMFSAQYGFGSNELNFNNHYNFSPRPGGASGSSLDISSADSTTYDPHNRGCLDIQAQTSLDSGDSDTHSSSLLTACRNERQWKSSEAVPASWEYRKSVHGFRNLPLDIRSGGCSSNMEGAIKPDLMEGSGGGGSLSHDMDILIKQEVDGLDMNNLQSSHISGDSVEADMTSPDHMTSVDSTTFLPCPSVSPQPNSSQAALSLHPDRPHMGHFGPGDHGDFSDLHQQQQPHHHQQHQLTHREFHSFIPGQIPLTNQEQAIRTSAMLYDDILAGYETDEVSTVLARLLGSAMRESIESLVKKTSCVKGSEDQQPNYFAKMKHEDIWMNTACTLADMMQLIIEFAKLVPGFRKFPQADQINLLKCGGGFEIALVWMSRNYDLQKECVLYNNCYLPATAFATKDKLEDTLVKDVFKFGHTVAQLKLCEKELGLLAAIVLLQSDRSEKNECRNAINKIGNACKKSLTLTLKDNRCASDSEVCMLYSQIIDQTDNLRKISRIHLEAVRQFRTSRIGSQLEFPALHEELFPLLDEIGNGERSRTD